MVQPVVMPPLSPDLESIDHLEGNEREIREYREAASADPRNAQNGDDARD